MRNLIASFEVVLLLALAAVSPTTARLRGEHHVQHHHHDHLHPNHKHPHMRHHHDQDRHHHDKLHKPVAPPPKQPPCFSTFAELQSAINALPTTTAHATTSSNNKYYNGTPELQLCANSVIEVTDGNPLILIERSVRLTCANAEDAGSSSTCSIVGKTTDDRGNGRLVEIIGTTHAGAPNTVVTLTGIAFVGGDAVSGGAIYSVGASVLVTHATFTNNVAQALGGALHVDDGGRAVVVVLAHTTFDDNLSMGDHCMSVYWHQQHPHSRAELNSEYDGTTSNDTTSTSMDRVSAEPQRQLVGDHHQPNDYDMWDDPAHAAKEWNNYRPHSGATLCL